MVERQWRGLTLLTVHEMERMLSSLSLAFRSEQKTAWLTAVLILSSDSEGNSDDSKLGVVES